MPTQPTRWSRRRARRALRRALPRFDVRLRSSRPGIAFTARIRVTVLSDPPYPGNSEELAGAIRDTLRDAANDIAKQCDPTDLTTATDRYRRHLAGPRSLATSPPVEFRADLDLTLRPDDEAAVATLLAAQRRQTVADVLRRQKTDALAAELADPAAVLAWWLDRHETDWSQFPETERRQDIANAFARYRPEHEHTTEHQLLELLREFLATFAEPSQKRMLYALLAAGMRGVDRPQQAAKAQDLLNGHAPPAEPAEPAEPAGRTRDPETPK
ncbi:hypothetical protein [Streptomyces sp. B22F1]|uniref:hypothetical protein n=1 Tax=Streptomyces sp. B22F1 TaxID=3153566 RepID=UPI00325EFF0F